MTWTYKGEPVTTPPAGVLGFVYEITNSNTGEYYIGQKHMWSVKKLPPLKGKKNKRHRRVESDWQTYWGSSTKLLADIELLGSNQFTRNILQYCNSKGTLNYVEAQMQFERAVLLDSLSYNGIINCKIHRKHLGELIEKL